MVYNYYMNRKGFIDLDLDEINWGVAGLALGAGVLSFFIAGYAGYSGFIGRLITGILATLISYFVVGGIANR